MQRLGTIKGVIFDLDGTLIDSMSVWSRIDKEFLLENGVSDPPGDISEIMRKMTVEESSQYFIDHFGIRMTVPEIIVRIEELVRKEYSERIQLKPGACDILDSLDDKKIPYGVATATYRSLAASVLERCGIYDRFRFLLTDADYPRGKNFPDIFLGAAGRLGTLPGETLVVEDSLHSIETAASAGFVTAGVYDNAARQEMDRIKAAADCYVMSLEEIKNLI